MATQRKMWFILGCVVLAQNEWSSLAFQSHGSSILGGKSSVFGRRSSVNIREETSFARGISGNIGGRADVGLWAEDKKKGSDNLDMITYLRTEWIAAAICSNQTPGTAKVCLQLGTDDGRVVSFMPKNIETVITSSAEANGKVTITAKRRLIQQMEISKNAKVQFVDQRADELADTEDNSVDVVVSLQTVTRMIDNGQDWKKGVMEAARVLKPGGRFLFIEPTTVGEEAYVDFLATVTKVPEQILQEAAEYEAAMAEKNAETATQTQDTTTDDDDDTDDQLIADIDDQKEETMPFELIGYDDVNMVLVPHVAGVLKKSLPLQPLTESGNEVGSIEDLETRFRRRRRKKSKDTKKKAGDNENETDALSKKTS